MNQNVTNEVSTSAGEKVDLILSGIEQLQQDLLLAKCEIKTAIRDVMLHQDSMDNLLMRLRAAFTEIDARLHGIEILQQRQNSST